MEILVKNRKVGMLLACPIGSETGKLGRGSKDCTSLQSQRKLAVATIVQQLHPDRGRSVKRWIVGLLLLHTCVCFCKPE